MEYKSLQNENGVERLIGQRIQKIRRANGYTQKQFAKKLGLSTIYMSNIERGVKSARLDKIVAIINTLECSADDVFSDVIKFGHEVKHSQLSDRLEALPLEKREKAIDFIMSYIQTVAK